QPGAYTTVMHGKNSTTGIGLLEVYSTLSGLTNVSTRGFVGTGDHVLIGGFISSGGNGSLQVIIRALGPTLTQFGVNGALADPTLALVNSNGSVMHLTTTGKTLSVRLSKPLVLLLPMILNLPSLPPCPTA